jgi:hypothetical protein
MAQFISEFQKIPTKTSNQFLSQNQGKTTTQWRPPHHAARPWQPINADKPVGITRSSAVVASGGRQRFLVAGILNFSAMSQCMPGEDGTWSRSCSYLNIHMELTQNWSAPFGIM